MTTGPVGTAAPTALLTVPARRRPQRGGRAYRPARPERAFLLEDRTRGSSPMTEGAEVGRSESVGGPSAPAGPLGAALW